MAATYEASTAPIAHTFLSAGETFDTAVDAGSGSNRTLVVAVFWANKENSISAVTYNGVAMTAEGPRVVAATNLLAGQIFRLAGPASGSNTLSIVMGAGVANALGLVAAWVANDTDQTTPTSNYANADGSDTTANIVSAVTVTSATNKRVVVFHGTFNVSGVITATPTNYTERQDGNDASGLSVEFGDAAGASSIASSATWSNGAFAVTWVALGVSVNELTGGDGESTVRPCVTRLSARRRAA